MMPWITKACPPPLKRSRNTQWSGVWRLVTQEEQLLRSGSLMTSWFWHAWCLGMLLCKDTGCSAAVAMSCMRRLCKSPISSDLDLRHTALRKEGNLILDNQCFKSSNSQVPAHFTVTLNNGISWELHKLLTLHYATVNFNYENYIDVFLSVTFLNTKNNHCIVFNLIMRQINKDCWYISLGLLLHQRAEFHLISANLQLCVCESLFSNPPSPHARPNGLIVLVVAVGGLYGSWHRATFFSH